ncbi:thioredoxin family protein [Bacillus fonticola]|uniref:thioredoxin family protein n=1 Tax=Bacillus fonticola TaxID=2728853 RepID=UPI0014757E72|nr:thioredoxin family protein [Bacillus fonticola]
MKSIQTKEAYEQAISSDQPVIIKFYADWCPDCKRMNMFIDDIVSEYNESDWFELNKDELPDISDANEVMGIPSLLIFQSGEKIAHLHSAKAKTPEDVEEFLATSLR